MTHNSSGIAATAAAIALTIAAAMALLCAPAALGDDSPLDDGETRLGLTAALRKNGVSIEPLRPAKLKGRELTLPVMSGVFNPDIGTATLTHLGGFKLVSGKKAVTLDRLRLDAETKSLSARVAGRRMRLADLAGAELERDGFDAHLVAKRLPLTRVAARTLNDAFDLPKVLRPGRSLGSVNGLGEPLAVQISFGSIAIGGPDTAFSKLESLDGQLGLWGGSEAWRAPGETYFVFPVVPTALPPDASAGVIEGEENDGVTMQIYASPPREMLLRHPRIDLAARELSATLSPISKENPVTATIATLDYSAATFQIRPKVGAFELTGIRAVANQFVADQLNERFRTPGLFQAGETLARVTMTLHAL